MITVIPKIRAELRAGADEKAKASFQRFFKERVKFYGVKTGVVDKIARKYWPEIEALPKADILALCEELYRSGYCEEGFIVSAWAHRLSGRYVPEDWHLFERWINTYITNWALCDGFCNHTVGEFIDRYPDFLPKLLHWAKADNRWLRRAAAVSLIIPAKRGRYLAEALNIADVLLTDTDDMVQKGYGWLLKEASRLHQKEVFEYVVRHKAVMPRTALRYAIELMPQDLRQKAMRK